MLKETKANIKDFRGDTIDEARLLFLFYDTNTTNIFADILKFSFLTQQHDFC